MTRIAARYASLMCLFVSPLAMALSDDWLGQNAMLVNGLFLALLVLVLVLATLAFRLRAALRNAHANVASQQVEQDYQRTLMDRYSLGLIHVNANCQVLFANRMAGFWLEGEDAKLTGKSTLELFDRDVNKALKTVIDSQTEGRLEFKTKNNRLLVVRIKPCEPESGKVAALLALQDITQYQDEIARKNAALEHLHALIDMTALGNLRLDMERASCVLDLHAARILGVQDEALAVDALLHKVHQEDRQSLKHALQNLKADTRLEMECRFLGEDKTRFVKLFGRVESLNGKQQVQGFHLLLWDISSERVANARMEHAQMQLKGFLQSTTQPAYILDGSSRLLEANAAFERFLAVPMMQMRGRLLGDLKPLPEALVNLHNPDSQQMQSLSGVCGMDLNLNMPNGESRQVRVNMYLQREDGQLKTVLACIQDDTALKKAEQSLADEKAKWMAVLKNAPVGMALMDNEEHLFAANPRLTERLGYSEQELKAHSLYQLFNDPDHAAKAAKQLQQQGQLQGLAVRLKGKDGQLHPSDLHIALLDNDAQQYLCWVFDTEEQHKYQHQFERLIQGGNIALGQVGENGFTRLSQSACELFQLDSEKALLGQFPFAAALHDEQQDRSPLEQAYRQCTQEQVIQRLNWEYRINGERVPCEVVLIPLQKGQALEGVMCLWRDLRDIHAAEQGRLEAINLRQATERQMAEKQQLLQSSQDQLASQVKTLSDTRSRLQEVEQDLSAKDAKISDLQQAHQSIAEHLAQVQQQYQESRERLAQSEENNKALEQQLTLASQRVGTLESQRNQIADALQNSERQFAKAQQALEQSEQASARLKQEQQAQQAQMQELHQQIDSLKASIQDKDRHLADISGQMGSLQSQLQSSAQASEKLREQLINQRKASEQAQLKQKALEQDCQRAQLELSRKARLIEHLQHEVQMFEQMSSEQQGTWQQQQEALQKELQEKQRQLSEAQRQLDESKRQTQAQKAEKEAQERQLQQLREELAEVAERAKTQQQKMQEADKQWQAQQQALQQALEEKQRQLAQSEQVLKAEKQQTEEEKALQRAEFEQLQSELAELKAQSQRKQQEISEKERQAQAAQAALQAELEAKQQQLMTTQQELDERQRQAELEKMRRLEQQQKLEQLRAELADVERRGAKQKEMQEGSEEERKRHLADIEAQKQKLQAALQQAEKQNQDMQNQLQGSLAQLQQAQTQVSQTQSGEQKLMEELQRARQQAEALEMKLKQQTEQEQALQRQLAEQQRLLAQSEENVNHLQAQQRQLTEELHNVQEEYSSTRKDMDKQGNQQSVLAEQLKALEQELKQSKAQLDDKEQALQNAQQQLQQSQQRLAEQEKALVSAHEAELAQARQSAPKEQQAALPEYAKLAMPAQPQAWFDLLAFLKGHPQTGSLAATLQNLLKELEQATQNADTAVAKGELRQVKACAGQLKELADKLGSEPLQDLASRLEAVCQMGQIDSVSIFWPNMKRSLMTTLRVIYSHIHA